MGEKSLGSKGFKGIADNGVGIVPFYNAEEVWFWFIAAQQARNDGARFVAGHGLFRRPCEPVDILKILDDLYRHRRLTRDKNREMEKAFARLFSSVAIVRTEKFTGRCSG